MPIQRFASQLARTGALEEYMSLLYMSHNQQNLEKVMCRDLISVNWRGELFDCDFNQMLNLKIKGEHNHLLDLINRKKELKGQDISVGKHCYGCTAGSGSSCGGDLQSNK